LPIDSGVDLHAPLPYPDAAYDVVILSEVVEHLFSFIPVVREAGRVLKPGGFLILSTPNLARLHSRWHYFWTGAHKLIRRRVGWDISADDFYAYHVNPLDFPVFHTVLFQTGMEVRSLRFTRFKPGHAWLLLLYPLVWLTTKLETSRHRSGEQLLVVAQKKKQDSWKPVRVNDESENSEGAGLQESRAKSPEA
jgi:SAM-dependent methyltransferase